MLTDQVTGVDKRYRDELKTDMIVTVVIATPTPD